MSKLEDFGGQLFASMEGYVLRSIEPLLTRLSALEKRPAPERGEKGEKGESVEPDYPLINEMVLAAVSSLPPPKDGKDADQSRLEALLAERIERAVAAIPSPKDGSDGKDVDLLALAAQVKEEVQRAVATLPPAKDGRDGKDVDSGLLASLVEAAVAKAVAEIPKPQDGKDGAEVDVAALMDVLRAHVATAVATIPKPQDGRDGKDVDLAAVSATISELVSKAVAAIPAPKDGRDGKDAIVLEILSTIDPERIYPRGTWARHLRGLWRAVQETSGMNGWECVVAGLAELRFELDGRAFAAVATLSDGSQERVEKRLPHVEYRGVFKTDEQYWRGDGVTWGGSWWIAQVDGPTEKPGDGHAWRLAVKRGREGKEGKPGPKGDKGERGERGEYVR